MHEYPRSVSSLLPQIIKEGTAKEVVELASQIVGRADTLPEAFMLLSAPCLTHMDLRTMGKTLFGSEWNRPARLATYIAARIGSLGFSFPKWRFITQSFEDLSLAERFGLMKLSRDTDVLDSALSDPHRDLFGKGFVTQTTDSYVEFRRAYLISSVTFQSNPVTILIRNNSFFFGRDRLRSPAYVCWEKISHDDLAAVTPDIIEHSGRFIPWQDVLTAIPEGDPGDLIRSAAAAFPQITSIERDLDRWLRLGGNPLTRSYKISPDGSKHLEAFLDSYRNRPHRPFLGETRFDMPPWFPTSVVTLDDDLAGLIKPRAASSRRLTLLSGHNGDFPA